MSLIGWKKKTPPLQVCSDWSKYVARVSRVAGKVFYWWTSTKSTVSTNLCPLKTLKQSNRPKTCFFFSKRTRKNRTTNCILLMPNGHGIKFGLCDSGLQNTVLKQPNHKFICHLKVFFVPFPSGVLLAVLEKAGAIRTYHNISAGTIAAGYQNFVVCIEMFLAAIALRFAFPYSIYRHQRKLDERGQGIALKSISRNLRQTINPKDIVDDAIHNFSRSYQHYANAQNLKSFNEESAMHGNSVTSYRSTVVDNLDSIRPGMQVTVLDGHGYKYDNENSTLLDSDEDF